MATVADMELQLEWQDSSAVSEIMPVMKAAFLDQYGEAWNESQCRSMLSFPRTKLLLARLGTQTVGFAFIRYIMDEAELLLIAVHPEHRRQNIASRILGQILEFAAEESIEKLFLEMRDENDAHHFYRLHGFVEIGRRKDYYRGSDSKKYDAITFRRSVS